MSRLAIEATQVMGAPNPGDTVIVEDGRVVAVTYRDAAPSLPAFVHEGTIVPALTDSHLHPLGYAALVGGTSLKGASSLADLQEILGEAAERAGEGRAVIAQRLDDTHLERLPTRFDLDAAVGDVPAIAYRYCGHVAVVNTASLRLAAVDVSTPDPPGGSLDRDSDGVPTGVLRETAVELVAPALEPFLDPPSSEQVIVAMEGLVAAGLRRIGAMASTTKPLWAGVGDELDKLCEIAPDLPLDTDVMVITPDDPAALQGAERKVGAAGGKLRFWGWKSFADGSLGGHTAAMWHPYRDQDTTGTLRLHPQKAEMMARTALDLGGVAAIHAIGDCAIDSVLDLFESLISQGAEPDRLRIEHLSVPSTRAIRRLAETGVIASIQPSFLGSEADWVPNRLGPDRPAYPFRTMLDAGVRMIAGSDCPVEQPDPLAGISAAVRRDGWNDTEQLSVHQAVSLYTSAPAEHFGGDVPLSVGAPADFLVLDRAPEDPDAGILQHYVAGRPIEPAPIAWPG